MRASKKSADVKAKPPSKAALRDAADRKLAQDVVDHGIHMATAMKHMASLEQRILVLETDNRALKEACESNARKLTTAMSAVKQKPAAQSIAVPLVVDDDDVLPLGQ
ncbi:MAG: hypothetical protein ACR2RA_18970 [Geminicoccaceae bacterium]